MGKLCIFYVQTIQSSSRDPLATYDVAEQTDCSPTVKLSVV